jgi:hypothetical protein
MDTKTKGMVKGTKTIMGMSKGTKTMGMGKDTKTKAWQRK